MHLDLAACPLPPLFRWLRDSGNIETMELARTFNCGIGMILFTGKDNAPSLLADLQSGPEPGAWIAGQLEVREAAAQAVALVNSESWD